MPKHVQNESDIMEPTVKQAFDFIKGEVAGIREDLRDHRDDLVKHNNSDIAVQTTLAGTCAAIKESLSNFHSTWESRFDKMDEDITEAFKKRDQRLYGNGQPGELDEIREKQAALEKVVNTLINKLAMAVGGGLVVVFILKLIFNR